MASPVTFRSGAGAGSLGNLDRVLRRLRAIPQSVRSAMAVEIKAEAALLAADIASVTPVAPGFERHPGELKESVHVGPGRDVIAAQVICDAKDADGRGYAPHVEFGHKTKEGSVGGGKHVPAEPFFYPSIHRRKAQFNTAMRKAMSNAIKALD